MSEATVRWRAAFVAVALLGAAGSADAACRADQVDLRTPEGGAVRFAVTVADTPATRSQGLMHVTDLPESRGMLFVFDSPQEVAFWMKNTPLPLDILYIDATGTVIRIAERTTPYSEASIPSGGPVALVLEVNGGLSARYGLAPGAQLRHPAVDPTLAVWPCD